jgi:hypothetical protein
MKEKPIAFASLVKLLEEAVGKETSYALLDPFPCETLKGRRPAVDAIQEAGKIIAQHLGLIEYAFVIAVTAQKPNTAGHIKLDRSGRNVFVELSPDLCECKDAVLATLCHELSHKFLHKHNVINGTIIIEQEFLTDVTAVYLGLGKIMLNGCQCQSSKEWTQDGQPFNATNTIKTGYISRDCVAFIYRLVCAMRGIPRDVFLRGLSTAAREAIQIAESNYADWFSPEFCRADGVAMLGDALTKTAEVCQDEAAACHRSLRRIEERLRAIKTSINESHRPLLETQRKLTWFAEPEPNPHLRFLKCLQTRESIVETLNRRDLQIKDVLSEWRQVETLASWSHHTVREDVTEIVECPLDGSKLRVPMGRKRLLVTCPSCKYKFLVNTGYDATASELGQRVPSESKWMLRVTYAFAASLCLALLIVGSVAGRRYLQAVSATEHPTSLCDTQWSPLPSSKTSNDAFLPVLHAFFINPAAAHSTAVNRKQSP